MKRLGPIFALVGALLLLFAADHEEDGERRAHRGRLARWAAWRPRSRPAPRWPSPTIRPRRCGPASPAAVHGLRRRSGTGDVERFWGAVECDLDDDPSAVSGERTVPSGGDPQPSATGRPPGDDSFRELVTHAGDDYFGERCEIGRNDFREEPNTVFYREGEHLLTFVSVRLPDGFPVETESTFQGVVQMKQTQPSDVGDEAPPIALGMYQGRWQLFSGTGSPLSAEEDGTVIGARRSKPGCGRGSSSTSCTRATRRRAGCSSTRDLNGDGDYGDARESSPVFGDDEPMATLRPEVEEKAPTRTSTGWNRAIPCHRTCAWVSTTPPRSSARRASAGSASTTCRSPAPARAAD